MPAAAPRAACPAPRARREAGQLSGSWPDRPRRSPGGGRGRDATARRAARAATLSASAMARALVAGRFLASRCAGRASANGRKAMPALPRGRYASRGRHHRRKRGRIRAASPRVRVAPPRSSSASARPAAGRAHSRGRSFPGRQSRCVSRLPGLFDARTGHGGNIQSCALLVAEDVVRLDNPGRCGRLGLDGGRPDSPHHEPGDVTPGGGSLVAGGVRSALADEEGLRSLGSRRPRGP